MDSQSATMWNMEFQMPSHVYIKCFTVWTLYITIHYTNYWMRVCMWVYVCACMCVCVCGGTLPHTRQRASSAPPCDVSPAHGPASPWLRPVCRTSINNRTGRRCHIWFRMQSTSFKIQITTTQITASHCTAPTLTFLPNQFFQPCSAAVRSYICPWN